jgi:hypothetical protein
VEPAITGAGWPKGFSPADLTGWLRTDETSSDAISGSAFSDELKSSLWKIELENGGGTARRFATRGFPRSARRLAKVCELSFFSDILPESSIVLQHLS